jgi:hypothetical protein
MISNSLEEMEKMIGVDEEDTHSKLLKILERISTKVDILMVNIEAEKYNRLSHK